MNLPNKLTISRIIMSFIVIIVLLGGSYSSSIFGFELPKLFINEAIVVDTKYIIAGIAIAVLVVLSIIFFSLMKKSNKKETK